MAEYDRFWELHVVAPNGWYDFASGIAGQHNHQCEQHAAKLEGSMMLVTPLDAKGAAAVTPLALGGRTPPASGYVASAASAADIAAAAVAADVQALVRWVNDAGHAGKLRINAHGDGMGRLGMAHGDAHDAAMTWMTGDAVAAWLAANGLTAAASEWVSSTAGKKKRNGLVTITMAVCMGARHGAAAAQMNFGGANSSAAPNSVVARVVGELRRRKLTGIEVTGSNELTIIHSQSGKFYRSVGMPPLGGGWDTSPDRMSIKVPAGWTVKPNWTRPGGEIEVPKRYAYRPLPENTQRSSFNGWELYVAGDAADTVTIYTGWSGRAGARGNAEPTPGPARRAAGVIGGATVNFEPPAREPNALIQVSLHVCGARRTVDCLRSPA
jgi:hypothetical protein